MKKYFIMIMAFAFMISCKSTFHPPSQTRSFDPMEPTLPKKVVRGGSFLCSDSYCSGYRVGARMKTSRDTGLFHTGFRCVADKNSL